MARAHDSNLIQTDDGGNGSGQPFPVCRFLCQVSAAQAGERVELGAAVILRDAPLGFDPALLFEFGGSRVERAVAHLESVARDLLQTLADGPAVKRFEG